MSEPLSFHDGRVTLHHGDCLSVLETLPENSMDSVVCDPPYHLTSIVKRFAKTSKQDDNLTGERARGGADGMARFSRGFMGKQWDGGDIAFRPKLWAKVLRVLKPGGHLFAFSGTRTYHRMACAIEDAGFEIRDQFGWAYGSGFPKSHDVSKAIDKLLGAERERVRVPIDQVRNPKSVNGGHGVDGGDRPWMAAAREAGFHEAVSDEAVSDEAAKWRGWGTAAKPAYEPICLARKPLIGTIAKNVLAHGTGALNIDGCRIALAENEALQNGLTGDYERMDSGKVDGNWGFRRVGRAPGLGRWPANICHDGSEEVLACFHDSDSKGGGGAPNSGYWGNAGEGKDAKHLDSGPASRFFYCAKAGQDDRLGSKHPTVKPLSLMRWLVRLVTPPGGLVLDPFAGTGTTAHAALIEGFRTVLIEREAEYVADIERRMALVFAGEIERVAAREPVLHADLPLFGGADVAGGGRMTTFGERVTTWRRRYDARTEGSDRSE